MISLKPLSSSGDRYWFSHFMLCIHSSSWSAIHKKWPGPGLASAASPRLTSGPAASHPGQWQGSPRSLTPSCLSLSDRLLQLQVMPLSRLHLRHFRQVQTCLVLYLLALLLYPQVSPFHLPPTSIHQEKEKATEPAARFCQTPLGRPFSPCDSSGDAEKLPGQGVVCLPSSGMREAGNQSCLEPERSRFQMYSFGELSAHTAVWISANPDWHCQLSWMWERWGWGRGSYAPPTSWDLSDRRGGGPGKGRFPMQRGTLRSSADSEQWIAMGLSDLESICSIFQIFFYNRVKIHVATVLQVHIGGVWGILFPWH